MWKYFENYERLLVMFKFKFNLVTSWLEPLKASVVLKLTHLIIIVTSHSSGLQATGISFEELSQKEIFGWWYQAHRIPTWLRKCEQRGLWRSNKGNRATPTAWCHMMPTAMNKFWTLPLTLHFCFRFRDPGWPGWMTGWKQFPWLWLECQRMGE